MKRIFFDLIIIVCCIFTPWMLTVTLVIIGLLIFTGWIEGLVGALLIDIVMFGGILGMHTVYMIAGFCALYYLAMRFKHLLRV